MSFNVISLISILLIPALTGCSIISDIFEKNYSLRAVASCPDDIQELKNIWHFCEKCLDDSSCNNVEVTQCKTVTIPSRNDALVNAIASANTGAVRFLVDAAKIDVNGTTTEYKYTPLIIAAYYGTKEHQIIAEFLLSRGADINKEYLAVGGTPLGVAIWKHNVDFAKLLLKHGAAPSVALYGKDEGFACRKAMSNELTELYPFIPGCCSRALHDLNFDPNIAPETISGCEGIQQ
ncbi:ankyrin repeat domain-containing protein [Salmonella enterica]|nr:ankyrin repeat domain-containing protein [Salmonella enterica]EHX3571731.1 ankyrin repeat domain-containing protein [Salmonella enterica]EIB6272410.1 ankyrin repeat domain-containing protein [Salmonella enterica]EIC8061016.1 ankyrin repeat domain-containing protein [Salmonella enterica]HCM1830773.1 ankyrin repeat domain-containing protein [Salmonella enterica subsp. salamae serovar 48:z81:z39]